ncbi:MAG: hypothetical protein ACTSYU_05610, partial [Promethearchaeota archaeon]
MRYFRSHKNNFNLQKLTRRCEQELIKAFQRFTEQIYEEIDKIDDSPQLQNLLSIGNAYSQVCEKFGKDSAYFGTYFRLIELIRNQDRKMEARMEAYNKKYHSEDSNKFRVTTKVSISHISTIFQSLKAIVTDYRKQIQEMQNQQELSKTALTSTSLGENSSVGKKLSHNFAKVITRVKSSFDITQNDDDSL